MSVNSRQRRHKNMRGPERFRWQPKEPPHFPSLICVILAVVLLFTVGFVGLNISPWNHNSYNENDTALSSGYYHPPSTRSKKVNNLRSRHYPHDDPALVEFSKSAPLADAIVVGSGLAGLTATLTILDRGGKVILIEKESTWGGNSNKASSGMNACCIENDKNNDTIAEFVHDTVKSAGDVADLELIDTLVTNSASALTWFQNRVGMDLSVLVQLGGHSRRRTHRPQTGFVGAELITAMESAIREYEASERIIVLVDTQVSKVLYDKGKVIGVEVRTRGVEDFTRQLRADHVVLATGGFASDRSAGSYLERYRPELLGMAATAGAFSTGDGITLAESLGAATRDMDKVQIHPTGFVDPAEPTSPNKVLAAELLRGVGGILLDRSGKRFCNELGTRAYVTDKMLEYDSYYAKHRKWNPKAAIPTYSLILSSSAAEEARKHVDVYMHKGLMKKLEGLDALADHLSLPPTSLQSTFEDYRLAAMSGTDMFGKTVFRGLPAASDLSSETFYVAEVTPVLHYCMGGIKIDKFGNVLTIDNQKIDGLHAAGEVTGGVHGNNRLGGNSLLECAVFGSIVGREIPIPHPIVVPPKIPSNDGQSGEGEEKHLKAISLDEISEHNSPDDAWVALWGNVYDLSEFAKRHPGGANSILSLAGRDGTEIFSSIHSKNVLSRLSNHQVGMLVDTGNALPLPAQKESSSRRIKFEELKQHSSAEDCWVAIHGKVYDLTEFSKTHKGGAYMIHKLAGKDGTANYQVFHPKGNLVAVEYAVVGILDDSDAASYD